jgi:hypothetical protein
MDYVGLRQRKEMPASGPTVCFSSGVAVWEAICAVRLALRRNIHADVRGVGMTIPEWLDKWIVFSFGGERAVAQLDH